MKELIKRFIRELVQLMVRIKVRKYIQTSLKYQIYQTKYKHTFFGYYDKNPLSIDNSKLLAMATNHDNIVTTPEESVVGYFDLNKNNKFIEVDKTTTWCWQQGCRLMWFDDNSILYNRVVEGQYGSVIYDIEKKQVVKQYNFAVYDKSEDNQYALSLNFSRSQYFRPGYGYSNFIKEEDKQKYTNEDGIFLCSLLDNSQKLIVSLERIASIDSDNRMEGAYHYLNHLKFFDIDKFVFYHVWVKDGKRYTRAIFSNIEGEILKVIDNHTFVSHDTFKNKNKYLVYTEIEFRTYYLYDLENSNYRVINKDVFQDGHPTFIDNKNILTDTYPESLTRNQKVMIFNDVNIKIIAKIFAPLKYQGEIRCDLHPRLNNDKKKVCMDIPTFGGRKLMVLDLDEKSLQ